MRLLRRLLVAVAALAAATSCQQPPEPDPDASQHPLPVPAPVVEVTMREYQFDFTPPAQAGHVVFRFTNAGQVIHRPAMVALPDEMPPIEEQLRGTERRLLDPLAGVYDRLPGGTGTFAIDLRQNQRYALVCFALDRDGSRHNVKGMAAEFRPEAPPKPLWGPAGL